VNVAVLFAGCGGSVRGHLAAGDCLVYANEIARPQLETLRLNLPDAWVDDRDVLEVRGREILERCGEVDVLDASPPCDDYSTTGLRDMNAATAWLLHEVPRVASELRPRAVVIENVTGLAKGAARKLHLNVLLEEFGEAGYQVDWDVLDASRLGVPQARERVVVIATRGVDPSTAIPERLPRRTTMRDGLPGVAAIVRPAREAGSARDLPYREPLRWPSGLPAPTVTTNGLSGGKKSVSFDDARVVLDDGSRRRVTLADVRTLMGFGTDHAFPERLSDAAVMKMLGDCVPPPMAEAWARSVARAISR
jgi:DNA (cytosine-5)-methyltransferase 1